MLFENDRLRRRVRRLPVVALVAAALVAAGCGGSGKHHAASSAPPSTPATSVSPTPTVTPQPPINPLTGGKPSANPVIAVKVEDTAEARPQVGLDQADIVYIEQVEGGLTRLIAVFNSHLPSVVEPIRSTRANDPELMVEYGPIIYVASGGSRAEYAPLDRSFLKQVINDRGGPGFSRDNSRAAPHNLVANLALIARKVRGPRAKSIGLTWSATIANPSAAGPVVSTMVGGTPVVFKWNARAKRYYRYYSGAPDRLANGHLIGTANVIVQFVKGNVYAKDIDPAGNPAWYQHTIGSGQVVVFRDGRRIVGHWSRPKAGSGTALLDTRGKPIALAPGGAWFVLVNTGTRLG